MLFLNSRSRNTAVSGVIMRDQSQTRKMGQSFIICGCLSVISGLIFIVISVISEIKKTTFIGIGIISLGVGFFMMTIVCFYGKLDMLYNNWAYRSRVLPTNIETPRPEPSIVVSNSPRVKSSPTAEKEQLTVPIETRAPITVTSDSARHKIIIAPSIHISSSITNNPVNVT